MPQTEIAHLMEALGQDVLQEAPQKFLAGDAAGAGPRRFALLVADRHRVIETDDAGVGDGHTEDIAGEIIEHRRRARAPASDMNDPGFAPGACGKHKLRPAAVEHGLDLPRTSLARALGGTRKRRSTDTPPPVTRQWTCG